MIHLNHVTKKYDGSGPHAVDNLDLLIETGTTVALIGPSGCGKTTTMRMINQLETPTTGRVLVDGRDIARVDQKELRRSIGYVIQQVGLFPHMSIARNVATVPRLLGWEKARSDRRVDELLDLVGLDPAIMRQRLPHELSGGQRQRVGFARALAADPAIMLMDEPFGAIDPITRVRLQDEFRDILRKVKKTVVIVTHDLDEAIKMGDRIAIMRDGRLLQYDSPQEILARPINEFVENFLGPDRAIKRLSLIAVSTIMTAPEPSEGDAEIAANATVLDALALILSGEMPGLHVRSADGALAGYLSRATLLRANRL